MPDRPCRIFLDDGSILGGGSAEAMSFPVVNQYHLQSEAFSRAIRTGSPIENGIEVERYATAPDRSALRREFGLSPDRRYVITVARFHPVKDHATLLRAFALVVAARPDVDLLLAGDADAFIADADGDAAVGPAFSRQAYIATVWGEFDGIEQQVLETIANHAGFQGHGAQVRGNFQHQLLAPLFDEHLHVASRFLEQ